MILRVCIVPRARVSAIINALESRERGLSLRTRRSWNQSYAPTGEHIVHNLTRILTLSSIRREERPTATMLQYRHPQSKLLTSMAAADRGPHDSNDSTSKQPR